MAIEIVLYQCDCDNRTVFKDRFLTQIATYDQDVTFKDSVDLHSPVFVIRADITAKCNYCCVNGVDDMQRWYFCRIENVRTGISLVRCDLDVLMMASRQIDKIQVIPKRSSKVWNDWIYDPNQPVEVAKYNYLKLPKTGSWDSTVPNGEWNYGNPSIIAAIVGNDDPTSVEVVS